MLNAAVQLFESRMARNSGNVDRALSETIQHIILLGLSRTDFFSKAAFYGGTALRMLYGLNRFSEDLDFSLIKAVKDDFRFDKYFDALKTELEAFGFNVEISLKNKNIESQIHIIKAGAPSSITDTIHRNAVCKVKLEIDTDPPDGAEYEVVYIDEPVPFSVKAYSASALFAGKMDDVMSRGWKNRVKGRDWYDFAFLVRQKVPLLLPHLEQRLKQKEILAPDIKLTKDIFLDMLSKRIETVDLNEAKKDILPFISDPREVDVWSVDYFRHVMKNIII